MRGVVVVVMGWSVDGLGPGHVAWSEIWAGSGGGMVEVWWRGVTVTTVWSGCSRCLIISCSCHRRLAHSYATLLFAPFALILAVRPSRTTRGRWGVVAAAAGLAFL